MQSSGAFPLHFETNYVMLEQLEFWERLHWEW